MNIPKLTRVIAGRRYTVETATVIASNDYWDGHNFERGGRNTWLLRTQRDSYFCVSGTLWQGEQDSLNPLTEEEAIALYEALPEHEVEYELAFPNRLVEDA